MTNETDLTTAIATEIAKQLPVKEALEPPARQTGEILQDIVKAIQLALAPVQLLGALQDRLRHFLDNSVRRVPENNRLTPPPQVLGPIIEAIRYEPQGTEIDAMFSELLSASMDQARVHDAHPAFVAIIRSLSPDEAKILKALAAGPIEHIYSQRLNHERSLFEPGPIEKIDLPDGLAYPDNGHTMVSRLVQLGMASEQPTRAGEAIMDRGKQTGLRNFNEFVLTPWGRQFMRAAAPPAIP
ncbi:DUF4393 domain-containing protein [Bradyrhizobium japonicum]|uniref:DUF4393 domain-containing protein n=1 Tax=Bradyrhizobium japonicum TaxID=375 RepID=UPI002714DCDB|nr:DUF4393 domain-containing protein [Bradyrhizobium japonicum]WLB58756.1 DUF4393 domain-containing protein [Bradyrhizobium japonicum]WLB59443.1 DUF4393 domain-containing protein [Bradyrhizobium japonicum]